MSDLRAQFESLAHDLVNDHRGIPYDVIRDIDAIVDSIPEGAVLVTEAEGCGFWIALPEAGTPPSEWWECVIPDAEHHGRDHILRHLREGT